MRNKTPLALMEQVIMLLVFALAAALCLQAFLWADTRSRQNVSRDQALVTLQTAAELTKHYCGDLETAANTHGGSFDGTIWMIDGETGDFSVCVTPRESETPYLGTAHIAAIQDDGNVLAELTVCWQEVQDNG